DGSDGRFHCGRRLSLADALLLPCAATRSSVDSLVDLVANHALDHRSADGAIVREPHASTLPVRWHIVTGEYPPQAGGVSDYTRLVARGLALAGDCVDVWAPPCDSESPECDSGVTVRRLPDHYGPRSLRVLNRELDVLPGPRRLLVQYVPHAFGW